MTTRAKKKWARWVAAGVALVILSIVGYLGWDMSRTASTIYEPLPSRPDTKALPPPSGGGYPDQQFIPNGVDQHMEQEAYAGHALPVSGSRKNALEDGQSFCMLLLGIGYHRQGGSHQRPFVPPRETAFSEGIGFA